MNKIQKEQSVKINKFLEQFGAKIKEGEDYTHSQNKIMVLNRFDIERTFSKQYLLKMNEKKEFWSFDGNMSDREKEELENIRKIAENKGGKLISNKYINNTTKLEFQDKNGNIFFMSSKNIKKGRWSAYESNLVSCPDYHIKHLQEIAQSKGGKLISTNYINNQELLEFQDCDGNIFFQNSKSIKNGFWIPHQSFGISEEICRQCIEYIFHVQFPTNWNIIKRVNKKNLQLDGYNKSLNFAFEYQGEQHYEENYRNKKCINISKESFNMLKKNDEEKKEFCKINNILLLEIKFFNKCKINSDYLNHVIQEIKKTDKENLDKINKYLNNININSFKIDYSKIQRAKKHLNELKEIAEKKGGKLISTTYKGSKIKLQFQDKYNNIFWVSPVNIKNNKWSPYESNRVRDKQYHINILQNIAIKKNGKLISTNYINNRIKLEFENEYGFRFFMSSDSIKRGCWNNKKEHNYVSKETIISLKIIKKTAKKKGLFLISDKYENIHTNLNFIDLNENHHLYNFSELQNLNDISPNEYYLKELNIIAQKKDGKLISTKYINNITKLEFEDSCGNRFFDTPLNIKNNHWIPSKLQNKEHKKNYYLNELRTIAQTKGGRLISTKYINNTTKLEFEDASGNRFFTSPDKIKQQVWSPYESKNVRDSTYNLDRLQKIAESKGGKLISTNYINNSTELEFEDSNGNKFFRKGADIMRGRWTTFKKSKS